MKELIEAFERNPEPYLKLIKTIGPYAMFIGILIVAVIMVKWAIATERKGQKPSIRERNEDYLNRRWQKKLKRIRRN